MKLLLETENPLIINDIKNVFQIENKDLWKELSEEQKADIEVGERQIEDGEFVTLDEMMAILKQ